jgi:hypothetical protein
MNVQGGRCVCGLTETTNSDQAESRTDGGQGPLRNSGPRSAAGQKRHYDRAPLTSDLPPMNGHPQGHSACLKSTSFGRRTLAHDCVSPGNGEAILRKTRSVGDRRYAYQLLDEARRSTRVLASPISHGTHNRAEVATLLGQHVLSARGTHRIEPPLHNAIPL